MKIKDGYVLNEVGNMTVAIYIGEDESGLNGIVNLNKLGAYLWKRLETGCTFDELVSAVTEHYDVDEGTASKDIEKFLDDLRKANIIEE